MVGVFEIFVVFEYRPVPILYLFVGPSSGLWSSRREDRGWSARTHEPPTTAYGRSPSGSFLVRSSTLAECFYFLFILFLDEPHASSPEKKADPK